jgi:predicted Zn-dependent peptidase
MGKLKKTPVEPTELRNAKEFTKGNLMLASESNDNQMVRLAQNEINFGRFVALQEILDKIESVTENDILELAQSLLQRNKLALTILGPVSDKKSYEDLINNKADE